MSLTPETPDERHLERVAAVESSVHRGLWSMTVTQMTALCDWAEGAQGLDMRPMSGDHRPPRMAGTTPAAIG